MTCLHLASKNGCIEICLLLIARGCDVNIRDDFGNNASYWARVNKHMKLLNFLPPPLTVTAEENKDYREDIAINTLGWKPDELKKLAALEAKKNAKKKKK